MTQAARWVYIVDDDAQIRKSLHFLLTSSLISPWPFKEAADFLDQQPTLTPAPILLDLRMPGISGMEVLEILKEREVSWPVIVMSAHGDIPVAVSAMKLGAIEFLVKPFQPDLLDRVLAIAFVAIDEMQHSQQFRDEARNLLSLLSPREREIIEILTEGVPNKEAAHRLALSTRTVEMHRRNALIKLGCKSITEVIVLLTKADVLSKGDWGSSEPLKLVLPRTA